MTTRTALGTASLALALALAGCGGERQGALTAEEDRQLNEAAAMLEDNVFDTSADSLVAEETVPENGEAASESNGSGNAQ
ncbi:MAG: hypothetical protein KF780_05555 [Sphingomonas sp.]|nr:hypothetical protein [Sphingomonas sp.]